LAARLDDVVDALRVVVEGSASSGGTVAGDALAETASPEWPAWPAAARTTAPEETPKRIAIQSARVLGSVTRLLS
jgi:hypothetical protein